MNSDPQSTSRVCVSVCRQIFLLFPFSPAGRDARASGSEGTGVGLGEDKGEGSSSRVSAFQAWDLIFQPLIFVLSS